MAFSTRSTDAASCEINVTPLLDVLLVLLIIFMVIVPVASRGLAVETPSLHSQSAAPAVAPGQPVLVEITSGASEGRATYRVNGADVAAPELEARLKLLLEARAERQVLLRADPALSFSVVAEAIDRGRLAGADRVSLLTPGLLPLQ